MNTQTETKHTPGPWRWHDEFILAGGDVGTRKGKCIAVSVGGFHWETEPEKEANARLIAAAPELLEALRAVLPLLDIAFGYEGDVFGSSYNAAGDADAQARAAIAKATGGAQ